MAAGQVVVVCGASAGVGRATAVEFARGGARLALVARGAEGLEGARREVEEAGGSAITVVADMSDPDQVEAAAERAERELGPLDCWVNSAMVTVFSPVTEMTADEYRRVTEVTYLGTVFGTQAALRRMRPRNRGTIVQVGSALAYRAIPLQSAYCAAKFAVRGFTDALRSELIHDGCDVRLTMVQLAAFNTPQFSWARTHIHRHPQPLPPILQPEVAARGIVWAAHHRPRELTVGSAAVKTILASKLFPALLDQIMARQAYGGQHTDQPIDPDRPDNLFTPLPGDWGRHGVFADKAKNKSRQLWANTHRTAVTVGVMAVAAVAIALLV